MALIRDRVGDNFDDYLYSSKKNIAEYAKQLQASGYIPNENEGLLDSLQSGLWGGLGGLLGGASALAKEQGWDGIANWTGNEAQHAGNRAQANAYTGKWEEGNYLNYALNQGAQALGSSVPSLIGDIATTAAIGTVAGGPVGTALGAVVGAGKWANRLYEGSKLVQYGAKAGKFATGVVAGGLIENATNAGDTYMTGLQRGMDHSQSYDAMKTTFNEGWAPAMANYAFDKISMQGSLGSGITSAFATGGGKVLAKGAVATAVNAGVGAVGEAVTEAWQQQIQEKALGTPEYKNVNIYDPTSWTQDMKDQAFDAGIGSIPLGLISGTFSSGKTLSQKENEKKNQVALEQAEQAMNATPTLGENPAVTTPSEEGGDVDLGETTPTVMPEAPSTDGENASLDLSEETPEHMVERPRDELDDAFDGLNHAHYKKQGKSDDDILEMNNNARATTEMIHQKWEEHTPEAKYSPNAFVSDFREQGYTEKDARKLSRATVEMYEKKQPKESSNEPTLVERAESVGYNLSDDDKESINNGTMPKAIMGSIEKNIVVKEKEVAEIREQERKVQEENQKREEYNNHYKDSVNKGFLEEVFREVPDGPNKDQLIRDTGYAIREATSEYNKEHAEHKSGKRKNKPVGLQNKLAQKGIKSGNTYTREQVDNIVDHVEDIQKTRKDNPTTTKNELRKRGFENASLGKIDNAFNNRKTKNKINVKAEKNDKRFENFYLDEANKLIETAKATGLPVERSKTYKAIRDKSTQGFRNIQDALFPKVEAPKKEGVKKEKSVQEQLFTPIEDNKNTGNLTKKQKKQLKQAENERKLKEAQAKLEEENKTGENVIENNELAEQARLEQEKEEEAKEAIERYGKEQKEKDENEEGPDDEWIESAIADGEEEKKTREAFEEKGNKESVNTKEKPKANTKKSWSKEDSHAVVDRYLNGEINKEQAINELVEHEGKVTRKNKEYIQKLKKSVNYYNDKKEETRKKANNEKEMTNMINGIDSSITALKEQIENGTTENKDYDRKVESIKKKIKDAYLKHPSLLKTHPNLEQSIPLGKPINKKKLLDEIESGERELTRREITNLLNSPAKFIRDLTGWVRKVVNNPDINLQQPEINKVVKRIIDDEYKDIIDAYGSIEKAVASSQGRGRVRTFSKAVAGLFPKEHFHNSLIKSQKDRQKALKLTDRGLATSKTRGDLDKYKDIAKRFFKDEFEPDTKDKEFLVATAVAEEEKPKKEDGRKYNNVKPAITLKSVEALGDDTFRYVLDFDKEKGWTAEQIKNDFENLVTPYTDNMFIDSEVNNVEINEEAGTITFEGEPMLSYKDFSDTMESSTKANDKKTSLEARAMVVSAAIDTAPDRVVELALDKKDVSVVQKYLNDTFGNDKYGVYEGEEIQHLTKNKEEPRLEGTFFIYSKEEYPTTKELETAIDDEYFYSPNYQFGKDSETEQSTSKQKEEDHNILKGLTNNYNEQQRLSDDDITLAYQGINNYTKGLGARRAVFRLLGKGKNVYQLGFTTRKELDFNALADTHTGRIEVTEQGIYSGGSALLHEVAHLAVDAISMAGSLDQPRHPLWKQLTDVIKEGKADYENIKYQMGDSEGDIRVPVSSGTNEVRGRVHEGTTRGSLEGNEGSGSEHQRGGRPSDMQSGLQGETLELDSGGHSGNSEVRENGRNVNESQSEQLQGNLEQVPIRGRNDNGGNSGRGRLTRERRVLNEAIVERWDLARELVDTTTKDNAKKVLNKVRKIMHDLHGKSDMYHEEKAHGLISLVDAMFKIDSKLGNTKFNESLTYQLLTDIENGIVKPNRLLHETFAYSSHTVMSKDGQKSFFDKATEHLNPDIIKDNQTNIKNSFIHAATVNISRLLELFGLDENKSPGLMKKSTWAGSLNKLINTPGIEELRKYKKHLIILKNDWYQGIKHTTADGDMYSGNDRTVKGTLTKERKKKEEKLSEEEIIDILDDVLSKNNGRAGIVGDRKAGLNYFQSTVLQDVDSNEAIKDHELTNRNLLSNDDKIRDLIVQIHYLGQNASAKKALDKLPTTEEKMNYIMGAIDSSGNEQKTSGKARINGNGFTSKLLRALLEMTEKGDATDITKTFQGSGKKADREEVRSLLKQLHRELSHRKRSMTEIKAIDGITPDMVTDVLIDMESKEFEEKLNVEAFETIKKAAKEAGINIHFKDKTLSIGENVAKILEKSGRLDEIKFQKGKDSTQVAQQKQPTEAEKQAQKEEQEAKEQPILSAGKKLAREVSKKAGIKTPDNIEIINRDTRSGNISGWGLKKWFVSPIRMIQKYIPQAGAIIKWAEKAENDQTKLMQNYYRLFDKMKQTIGDKSKEFEKLTREINELGRDFVQTIAVNHNGKEYYVNLTDKDTFEEFMEESSAKNRYNELRKAGKKAFMDFKENKWRVLASDTGLRTIGSYSDAKQKARTATIQAIKDKGYSKEVAYAYNHWITLREKIYNDKVQAWKDSGQDEDQRPKLLWGYTPSLHGKYGVYKVKVVRDDENGEYRQYDKLASFKTQKDAMEYASQFANDGNSYSIVEHGSRFDDARTASAIYEDSYDPSYDTILEELESPEDINKRFERISHSYPMIAKIIDEFITKGKGLNREQFIELLEDKEKLADLGIDKKQLQEERKHANLDELFRLKPTVGKLDIQKHLLINYGNHMRDKFNQTRMNAKGANPDVLGNMEDYIRYNARYIPTSVFYYKSTALYRDITGRDYKSQFGIGGEGAQNDYQEILNNFIGSVVGLPNGVDKMLNQVFNDVFGKTWVKAMFGEKAVTDALGFSMQTITVLKLGMFRPTAAIAQLGTLMNITTFSGFNKLTAQAMRDASLYSGNVSLSEKKMFNRIGLNREDTALETQALMNEKSIYNMNIKGLPIGKFLEKSMFMFNATDKYTRRVAALVAYRQAIVDGKTPEEATDIARDFVRKTNFDYSDKDAPQLFTKLGSIGKLLLQFKKYPVKEAELMMELFQSGDKKAIARFFGQYLVMAGMMGVPVAGAGDELAEWITGTSPTKEMKKLVMEWAGNDPNKKSLALVAMYGVPALAGVDFSRNIGLGDLVPTNGFQGPTISTIQNVYKAFRDHEGANNIMSNIAKELSPAYANYYQALTGRKRDWNKDVDTRNYSTGERVAKGLGFRPVSDSVEYDTYSIVKDKQDKEKVKKQKLINKYLDDPKSVTKKELHQAGVKGADIRRAQENLTKTKTEKALANMPKKKQTESKRTASAFADFEEDL
jgi:PREDICTED: hypothetical protein